MNDGRGPAVIFAVAGVALSVALWPGERHVPIRVGVLHSQSGTMASSEKPVVDATLLAIEEINEEGGLLGRKVEAIVADGRSNPEVFAREAEVLISRDGVRAIFGCWTSASHKTVLSVVERLHHLLFYPVQYEGLEQSRYILYAGAAPNQQVLPAVHFAFLAFGSRLFLVGSDYLFPRAANAIVRDKVAQHGGQVVGEKYVPLGGEDFSAVVDAIRRAHPDAILNTINGDSNRAFFRELRAAGVSASDVPTISLSVDENVLGSIGADLLADDYVVANYFQSVDSAANRRFVDRFRARFGRERATSDAMAAAYANVRLWAQAVTEAGSEDIDRVRDTLAGQSLDAPGGMTYVDPDTRHLWKRIYAARVRHDGQLEIVWTSDQAVRPAPFPPSRTRSEWEAMLAELRERWSGRWAAPGA